MLSVGVGFCTKRARSTVEVRKNLVLKGFLQPEPLGRDKRIVGRHVQLSLP
jgi:hypothetical protein